MTAASPATWMIDINGIAMKLRMSPAKLTLPNSRAPIGASAISAHIVAAQSAPAAASIRRAAARTGPAPRSRATTGAIRDAVVTIASVAPNDRTKPASSTVSGAVTAAQAPATASALSAGPR